MTITLEKKETEIIDLPTPCFFRDKSEQEYVAILDEKTVVTIYKTRDLTIIKNSTPDLSRNDIEKAYKSFVHCGEQEFLDKYDAVVESISLHPKLQY